MESSFFFFSPFLLAPVFVNKSFGDCKGNKTGYYGFEVRLANGLGSIRGIANANESF